MRVEGKEGGTGEVGSWWVGGWEGGEGTSGGGAAWGKGGKGKWSGWGNHGFIVACGCVASL